jgi:hypothetical protein
MLDLSQNERIRKAVSIITETWNPADPEEMKRSLELLVSIVKEEVERESMKQVYLSTLKPGDYFHTDKFTYQYVRFGDERETYPSIYAVRQSDFLCMFYASHEQAKNTLVSIRGIE